MKGYKSAVEDGIKTVPHIDEIKRIFTNEPTDHFITQFGFHEREPVMWNTEVFFGGQYIFTYQVYVAVDYAKYQITKTVGAPKFSLVRVNRVFEETSGNTGADFSEDYKFDEAAWEKIVANHGDFSVIGIRIDTNHYIQGFDKYVGAVRRDRVQVK
jgi:hypothetical protein